MRLPARVQGFVVPQPSRLGGCFRLGAALEADVPGRQVLAGCYPQAAGSNSALPPHAQELQSRAIQREVRTEPVKRWQCEVSVRAEFARLAPDEQRALHNRTGRPALILLATPYA